MVTKTETWHLLIEEAKEKQECVCCGKPLRRGPSRRRVRCQSRECLTYYNAMYRRLKRPAALGTGRYGARHFTDDQVRAIRASLETNAHLARLFGVTGEAIRRIRRRIHYAGVP